MYFIQCIYLFAMLMSNFCIDILEAVQVLWECLAFHLRFFFVIFASQLSSILFTRSHHARFLILAQHPESRRMLPVMHLKVLNFYEGSHLLLHLLIEVCSVFYPMWLFSSQC